MSGPGGQPVPEELRREAIINAAYEQLVPDAGIRHLFNEAAVSQNVRGIIEHLLTAPQNQPLSDTDVKDLKQQLDNGFDQIETRNLDDARKDQARSALFAFATETSINGREPILKLTTKQFFKDESLSGEDIDRYYPVVESLVNRFGGRKELTEQELNDVRDFLFANQVRKSDAEKILAAFTSLEEKAKEKVVDGLLESREEEIAEKQSIQEKAQELIAGGEEELQAAQDFLRQLPEGDPRREGLEKAKENWETVRRKAQEMGLDQLGRAGYITVYYMLLLAWVAFIGSLNLVNKASAKKR